MKFFIDNWFLILVAFVSGGMLVWPLVSRSASGRGVSPTQAVLMINRDKAVVIDVSEPHEYAQGHVKGARHIPFGQLESSKDLPSNKALPLILVCPSGVRASRAAATLRKLGYQNVVPLAGGLGAWREANLPVEKSAA
ncbi:MAG TPA: rhodanese-like domain-containing protein [Burkholderiaceae bacterium]|nr:rhodanese-like domain-containing protein [Burkholderiaceae bacterium]